MQGQSGGELTDKGFTQAKLLSKRLAEIKFSEIFVSDLNRTKQTAEMIVCHHQNTPLTYDERLRERCGGIFEGKPISVLRNTAKSKNIPMRKFKPINGENWIDVYHRGRLFINELISKYIKADYVEEIIFKSEVKIKDGDKSNKSPNLQYNQINSGISNTIIIGQSTLINVEEINIKKSDLSQDNEIIIENSNSNSNIPNNTKTIIEDLPKILLITHGGFIMELVNVIRNKKGFKIFNRNDAKNTALYVIRIYCSICGKVCQSKERCGKLEYDFVIYNDNSHCNNI